MNIKYNNDDYARIIKAIRFLEYNIGEQPKLSDLASHLDLSEYHLHRLFHQWAGVTPKDFLQILTLAKAKSLLRKSESILSTSLCLGLSGSSRLHDLFLNLEAMTPGEYKAKAAGIVINWGIHETPFGDALFGATDRGLCYLSFISTHSPYMHDKFNKMDSLKRGIPGDKNHELADLKNRWPEAILQKNPDLTESFARKIQSRMQGKIDKNTDLNLLLKGSPFQVKVWEALLSIPEGQVATYQRLATLIGMPQASRAVGNAVASNPIGYIIPCHRIIRASGVIGNYYWGTERKTVMLAVEGARQKEDKDRV